jgi:hypothetical protein
MSREEPSPRSPRNDQEIAMNSRNFLRCIGALVAAAFASFPAQAQVFRAYVASAGSDANPCSLQQPCRLLPAALTAVADGGEIWMLDSANYNTSQVNVTKSVTILAIPGAVGSVVATAGGDAININAAGAKVTLRNLAIVHLTSSNHGINFAQGTQLGVSDCEIANIQGSGIYVSAPASKLSVSNASHTRHRRRRDRRQGDRRYHGLARRHPREGAAAGRVCGLRPPASRFSNSILADNTTGAIAISAGGTTTRLVVAHSTVTGNAEGIRGQTMSATDAVSITARGNSLAHSTLAAIRLNPHRIVHAQHRLRRQHHGREQRRHRGLERDGQPSIRANNNAFRFNTPDVSGGALTGLAAAIGSARATPPFRRPP